MTGQVDALTEPDQLWPLCGVLCGGLVDIESALDTPPNFCKQRTDKRQISA
ncbi:hypothetical protein IRJ41_002980 [Triplophysa rosa]|uniref:Uncharacterized protein n=1 Tax=Triplophysa rosa TaxID=992332 RepID=A0A9W7WQ63_TRIRA|nr:hypothetical protein IRJ41_002980 [Triplophysa rosa]